MQPSAYNNVAIHLLGKYKPTFWAVYISEETIHIDACTVQGSLAGNHNAKTQFK